MDMDRVNINKNRNDVCNIIITKKQWCIDSMGDVYYTNDYSYKFWVESVKIGVELSQHPNHIYEYDKYVIKHNNLGNLHKLIKKLDNNYYIPKKPYINEFNIELHIPNITEIENPSSFKLTVADCIKDIYESIKPYYKLTDRWFLSLKLRIGDQFLLINDLTEYIDFDIFDCVELKKLYYTPKIEDSLIYAYQSNPKLIDFLYDKYYYLLNNDVPNPGVFLYDESNFLKQYRELQGISDYVWFVKYYYPNLIKSTNNILSEHLELYEDTNGK